MASAARAWQGRSRSSSQSESESKLEGTRIVASKPMDATGNVVKWLEGKMNTTLANPSNAIINVSRETDTVEFCFTVANAFPEAKSLKGADWRELFDHVMTKALGSPAQPGDEARNKTLNQDKQELRKAEFEMKYVGAHIPQRLKAFIDRCWKHYCLEAGNSRVFPYTTIVQSSGFGKSRLLYELATRLQDGKTDTMRLLYICIRKGESSGYPAETQMWPGYLFPTMNGGADADAENVLSNKLQKLFQYAMDNWASIQAEYIVHFNDSTAGEHTLDALRTASATASRNELATSHERRRVLVLALDEARWLLETSSNDPTGWFRRLRRALNRANNAIAREHGSFAGIFAILIDTNSKISNFTPPPSTDASARDVTGRSVLFPPFILTHTMDIFIDERRKNRADGQGTDFYADLLTTDTDAMRDNLVDMGRPLWQRYKVNAQHRSEDWKNLLCLAASKLVGGQDLHAVTVQGSGALHGVTALLCRVGVRPYSWSPLATRVVADHMAVLSYINSKHDQFVSSYSSDPILTFGAARVWYREASGGSTTPLLESHILPELRTMLKEEVLDTGGVGELVARIVLLMVMDSVGVVTSGVEGDRCYDGKFYSVATFLRTLSGNTADVRADTSTGTVASVDDLLKPWESWHVGFSHFVQLSSEPTAEMLRTLLARRAAGTLWRNYKGIDLLIPIFNGDMVSMIAIQVKNRVDRDAGYPSTAVNKTRPGHVFQKDLHSKKNEDVVRVYMSLRGFDGMQQFLIVDPGGEGKLDFTKTPSSGSIPRRRSSRNKKKSAPQPSPPRPPRQPSLVCCVQGLKGWRAKSEVSAASTEEVDVVSQNVANQLKELLEPYWDLMDVVNADLERRDPSTFRLDDAEVREIAQRPTVSALMKKWNDVGGKTDSAPRARNPEKRKRSRSSSESSGE